MGLCVLYSWIQQLFITSGVTLLLQALRTQQCSCSWGSPRGLWAGPWMLGQPQSRRAWLKEGRLSWGQDSSLKNEQGSGDMKDSGSQTRVLHMKWPGYQRQRGTWKICHSQEVARKPQRSSGTGWCKNHDRSSDVGTGILLTGCCGAPKCSFEKKDVAREGIFQSFNHEHRGKNELWAVTVLCSNPSFATHYLGRVTLNFGCLSRMSGTKWDYRCWVWSQSWWLVINNLALCTPAPIKS